MLISLLGSLLHAIKLSAILTISKRRLTPGFRSQRHFGEVTPATLLSRQDAAPTGLQKGDLFRRVFPALDKGARL
jgi:hypothetical protein